MYWDHEPIQLSQYRTAAKGREGSSIAMKSINPFIVLGDEKQPILTLENFQSGLFTSNNATENQLFALKNR